MRRKAVATDLLEYRPPAPIMTVVLKGDPCSDLSPNRGRGPAGAIHARNAAIKAWRKRAGDEWLRQNMRPILEPVIVYVDVYRPRTMDVQNVIAALKAPIDGIVQVGGLVDDGPRWVLGFHVRQTNGAHAKKAGETRVEVTLVPQSRFRDYRLSELHRPWPDQPFGKLDRASLAAPIATRLPILGGRR